MKEAELLLVIKRGTPNIRMQVARQTNGVQILHFLIADHIETAEAIAENQTTPQDVLDTLAQTRRIRVMLAVAKHPATSRDTLVWLARQPSTNEQYDGAASDYFRMLEVVALHSSLQSEDLAVLARNTWPTVRSTVASRPDIAEDILLALASDSDPGVRLTIVNRPALPVGLQLALEAVGSDGKDQARDYQVRHRLARRSDAATDVLRKLALDHDADTRRYVAHNSQTPKDTLKSLTTDRDEEVVECARNSLSRGSACFIATASLGSENAPAVLVLRQFRDNVLLRGRPGCLLVECYCRLSPPVADWIRDRRFARNVVKWVFVIPSALLVRILVRLKP
ncbi:MAG: hypothetical protein RL514_1989 [Verrucomicrobiota bacterium]